MRRLTNLYYTGFAKYLLVARKICKEEVDRMFSSMAGMQNVKKLELVIIDSELDYWLLQIMKTNDSLPEQHQKSREQYKAEIIKRSKESIYTTTQTARQVFDETGKCIQRHNRAMEMYKTCLERW